MQNPNQQLTWFILISIWIVMLVLIIIFKKQIHNYYNNIKWLSKDHANFYKKFVIKLIPTIFIIIGIYWTINNQFKEKIFQSIKSYQIDYSTILWIIFIIFWIITIFLRNSPNKYKYFSKLSVWEDQYWKKTWKNMHIAYYTIIPIIIGIFIIIKTLFN